MGKSMTKEKQLRNALIPLSQTWLTTSDIARLYGVHRVTAHGWFVAGKISKEAYARTAFIPSLKERIDWRSLRPDLSSAQHLRYYNEAKKWAHFANVEQVESEIKRKKTRAHLFEESVAD
jgi:hypothetical protein